MKSFVLFIMFIGLLSLDGDVEVVKWPALEKYIHQENEKIKVINFWATWCKPCMEELPHF